MRENFLNLKKSIGDFRQYRDKIVSLALANQENQAINAIYVDGVKIAGEVQDYTDKLLNLKVDLAKQSSEKNVAIANTAIVTMIIVIIVGMLWM